LIAAENPVTITGEKRGAAINYLEEGEKR